MAKINTKIYLLSQILQENHQEISIITKSLTQELMV